MGNPSLSPAGVPTSPHQGSSSHPVLWFVLRRTATGIATLFVISILIFLATNVLPGNAAEVILGRNANPTQVRALEAKLDLNRSPVSQYFTWLGGLIHGSFGRSAVAEAQHRPDSAISATLASPLGNSLVLALLTAAILIPMTLLFGLLAGIHAGRKLDHAISLPSLVTGGLPEFVMATLLIFVFFNVLDVLPPVALLDPGESALSHPDALVLPVVTLLAAAIGAGIRQVRAGMVEVLKADYVDFARLNGVDERRVLIRYALRNALAPSVQIIAQNLQYLVGGIIIVESVFAFPGIGTYLVNAVTTRDVAEVQAAAMLLAGLYIGINVVADLIVVLLVPRLRTGLT